MAWADRGHYEGGGGRRGLFGRGGLGGGGGGFGGGMMGGRFDGAHMTLWLLAINFIVFVVDGILTTSARGHGLSFSHWGTFSLDAAVYRFQVWRFFTYQFLHSGFWHLFWNMLGLFFFGPLIERWWGSRRFLAFYLLCGVSGALFYLVLYPVLPWVAPGTQLVGASGSLFGILAAAAVIAPDMRVMLLFPPIPIAMRTLAMIFLGLAAFTVVVGGANAGGEAAHLGGALMGFVLTKWPSSLNFVGEGAMGRTGMGRIGAMGGVAGTSRKPGWREKRQRRRKEREAQRDAAEQAKVDRILAKVHEHGMHSLSEKEKRLLKRATDRQRRAS